MKPKPSSFRSGMSLIEVLAIVAVILVLVAVLVPTLGLARRKSRRIASVNNLKQIVIAFKTWPMNGVSSASSVPMLVSVTNGGPMEYVGSDHTFPHFQAMSKELTSTKLLVCPDDVTRTAALNFQAGFNDSNISYFVGMDATDEFSNSFLVGDSHLAIGGIPVKKGFLSLWTNAPVEWTTARHGGEGNIGLVDGSVQQFDSQRLREFLIKAVVATNRLTIP